MDMRRCIIKRLYEDSQNIKVIEKNGFFDNLTGLPNINYLKNLFSNNKGNKNFQGTILIIELHDFSIIKNTYGYDLGDEVLKNAVGLLSASINSDTEICRGNGDVFIAFMPSLIGVDYIKLFCEAVFGIFEKPVFVGGRRIYLDINIGSAIYPDDGDSLITVLKKADLALYKSKGKGTNKAVFYYEGLQEEVLRRITICNNLRDAVHKDELEVYYQPQVDQKSKKAVKFEALLRWRNDELGNVPPVEFIPISEETGVIIEIGEWLLREVCKQIKEWTSEGHYYVIAINISQKQIQSEDFLDNMIRIMKEFDVPPNLIEIEITESILMSSCERNIQVLRRMQSMGIGITLDDFGTGYSSLSYLKTLPIDTIKIDKSFVDDIVSDKTSRDIISSIITLVKKLKLNITAEGVESMEQVDLLKSMGCGVIQGYYYSKPVPARAIETKYLVC